MVSWAHGTTGVADGVRSRPLRTSSTTSTRNRPAWFLDAGYAVAATGLRRAGHTGLHSYTVGEDLGNAVADIVPAVHEASVDPSPPLVRGRLLRRGSGCPVRQPRCPAAPGVPLAGTVAIAPSSHLGLALPAIAAGQLPADVVYGLYLLVGLSTIDPTIDPAELVGPAGSAVLDRVTTTDCLLDTLAELDDTDVAAVFDLPADDMARLSDLLASVGDPDQEPTVGPVLVVQGETDHDIPAAITAGLVAHLRELGVDVTERVYPGLDHDRVLGPSVCETLSWMAERRPATGRLRGGADRHVLTLGRSRLSGCRPAPAGERTDAQLRDGSSGRVTRDMSCALRTAVSCAALRSDRPSRRTHRGGQELGRDPVERHERQVRDHRQPRRHERSGDVQPVLVRLDRRDRSLGHVVAERGQVLGHEALGDAERIGGARDSST